MNLNVINFKLKPPKKNGLDRHTNIDGSKIVYIRSSK